MSWVFLVQTALWLTAWVGAIITVVLSRRMKRERLALIRAFEIIEDQSQIIDCLASRGSLVCDTCGNPIAPRTPTAIDEYEPHRWRIEHRACSMGSS